MVDETRYYNVSLDSDHDLSGNTLEVSLDSDLAVTVEAEPAAAPMTAGELPAPAPGFTRYWWRVLVGPGQPLDAAGIPEPLTLFGRLADAPEVMLPRWVVGAAAQDDPPAFTADCWPVTTPPAYRAGWFALTGEERAYAEALAVRTLRALTAGAVGGCPVTIRPCRDGCARTGTWAVYPVTGGGPDPSGVGSSGVWPVLDSGTWLNVGCTTGCSSCVPRNVVRLPGRPDVVEVRVDGAVLDPAGYYINGPYLIRADGTAWPVRQDHWTRPTDPGAFAVTYYPNGRIDGLGALAAGALAAEYAQARAGGKCRIPANARSVARQGVTVDLATVTDLFPNGLTGVTEADLFVRSVNPNRLLVPSVVWSPDLA